jgi:energy-coupling factor transport system permease protein
VAKLAAALLLTLFLVVTLDPVTPALALAIELAALPLFGVRPLELVRRGYPLLLSVIGIFVALVLFGADRSGAVVAHIGPIVVTTGLLADAAALSLRLVAIALPGVVVFATVDATDLADALIQNLRAPARFAIGTLAAFRLLPLLSDEWRTLTMARRARGIDAGRSPAAFASTMFALLVGAIRRGTRLATAMDARGFDSGTPRSAARTQRFGLADAALVAAGALAGAATVGVSLYLGTFTPLLT